MNKRKQNLVILKKKKRDKQFWGKTNSIFADT